MEPYKRSGRITLVDDRAVKRDKPSEQVPVAATKPRRQAGQAKPGWHETGHKWRRMDGVAVYAVLPTTDEDEGMTFLGHGAAEGPRSEV